MRKIIATFTFLLVLANLVSGIAFANNLAAFEALANGRWKKLKNQTQEEFFKKYGPPTKTKKEEKDGATVETYTYIEPGCRFRFTFVNRVFQSAVRNCF